jgi:hypothetical protein
MTGKTIDIHISNIIIVISFNNCSPFYMMVDMMIYRPCTFLGIIGPLDDASLGRFAPWNPFPVRSISWGRPELEHLVTVGLGRAPGRL